MNDLHSLDMETKLRDFIRRAQTSGRGMGYSEWIELRHMKAYVRWTRRYHPELKTRVDTFDVASVEVKEAFWNKGMFKTFLGVVERLAHENDRWVYVESVMSPAVQHVLNTREYESFDEDNYWLGF